MSVPELPYITAELPGCGGQLKETPSHFVVEEIPLYEPCGQGGHLYVLLTREGWNTRDVAEALAGLYSMPVREVGYAGMKDRHARCTQAFSLPQLAPADAERIAQELPFQVHWARQHTNKLKTGHLLGNRFRIRVSQLSTPVDEALARAQAIARAIAQRGIPNFYGAQRFGLEGRNVEKGRQALLNPQPRGDRWLRKLMISAYQAYLFNAYLVRRIDLGLFQQLLPGDIAKKSDTGGMFEVQDAQAEQPRYARGEIHFTGPMYGAKMWAAGGQAGQLEAAVLDEAGLTQDHFRQAAVAGTRRPARIWLPTIEIASGDDTLSLAFALPKGSFATVVLREFTKTDPTARHLHQDEDEL
jgi:tRNA pseudouridine13 synthase